MGKTFNTVGAPGTANPRKREREKTGRECYKCGDPDANFGPDPYKADINNDPTPYWMCRSCRHEAAMDV